ncbi:MAG: hypothetical protein RLN70_03200, partial [Rhodospirillaceae bacterium]
FPGRIQRAPIYRMVPVAAPSKELVDAIKSGSSIVAPLFSRRSAVAASTLLRLADVERGGAQVGAVGISRDIFADGDGPWHCRAIASEPNIESMVIKTRELAETMGLVPKGM